MAFELGDAINLKNAATFAEGACSGIGAMYERSTSILDQLIKIAEAVDRPHRYIVRLRDVKGHTELFDLQAFSARDAMLQAEIAFRGKVEANPWDQISVIELRPASEQKDGPYGA